MILDTLFSRLMFEPTAAMNIITTLKNVLYLLAQIQSANIPRRILEGLMKHVFALRCLPFVLCVLLVY
jgi:hypothetical protein